MDNWQMWDLEIREILFYLIYFIHKTKKNVLEKTV